MFRYLLFHSCRTPALSEHHGGPERVTDSWGVWLGLVLANFTAYKFEQCSTVCSETFSVSLSLSLCTFVLSRESSRWTCWMLVNHFLRPLLTRSSWSRGMFPSKSSQIHIDAMWCGSPTLHDKGARGTQHSRSTGSVKEVPSAGLFG